MKFTLHWLREFTPLDVTPAELARTLTLAGLEVETVEPVAPPFSGVVVVAMAKRSPAPCASRSRRATPGRRGIPPASSRAR